ncbi:hypothetical protein O181_004016 [Austropuccinia psidii MF-1]|uniref:Nuclear segregation protein Bfr1 n=1 Tax=Austropuccinia psidii MF-1 TaxID=1389203 RepID=A0A9Q3BG29_9BASI|nr:hypothetical protein [Austropuccinia psidii MF-1]
MIKNSNKANQTSSKPPTQFARNHSNDLNNHPRSYHGSGRPNKEAHYVEQEELSKQIEKIRNRLDNLVTLIEDSKTKDCYNSLITRRDALRDELENLRQEKSKLSSPHEKISAQITSANEIVLKKTKEINAARARLPYKSTSEVDDKIRQLESQIESGAMKIIEEKKAITEIQNLRAIRRKLQALGPQLESIEAEKAQIQELKKQLHDPHGKAITDSLKSTRLELNQILDQLAQSEKSRATYFTERSKLQGDLSELISKKREGTARYREANDKFFAKLQEDQQRRLDRQKAEQEARQAAQLKELHEQMREEASAPAYEREIEDCRTLILYFDKILGNTPSVQETNSHIRKDSNALPKLQDARKVEGQEAFEGMVAVKKKGVDNEEFFVGGGGKKGKKNKKLVGGEMTTSNQPLNLPLSTINALHALAVTVPISREDVMNTIATLSEKKKWFADNQARVTKERIAETEAKITAVETEIKSQSNTPMLKAEVTEKEGSKDDADFKES